MICPHCNRTIAEQDRYLMSRDRDGGLVPGAKWMIYLLLFFVLLAAFSLHAQF